MGLFDQTTELIRTISAELAFDPLDINPFTVSIKGLLQDERIETLQRKAVSEVQNVSSALLGPERGKLQKAERPKSKPCTVIRVAEVATVFAWKVVLVRARSYVLGGEMLEMRTPRVKMDFCD